MRRLVKKLRLFVRIMRMRPMWPWKAWRIANALVPYRTIINGDDKA